MDHDDLVVAREVDIALDKIRAKRDRLAKARERVFRFQARRAAVAGNDRAVCHDPRAEPGAEGDEDKGLSAATRAVRRLTERAGVGVVVDRHGDTAKGARDQRCNWHVAPSEVRGVAHDPAVAIERSGNAGTDADDTDLVPGTVQNVTVNFTWPGGTAGLLASDPISDLLFIINQGYWSATLETLVNEPETLGRSTNVKADLFREAIKTFVRVKSAQRLAALGGSAPKMQDIHRRRAEARA